MKNHIFNKSVHKMKMYIAVKIVMYIHLCKYNFILMY